MILQVRSGTGMIFDSGNHVLLAIPSTGYPKESHLYHLHSYRHAHPCREAEADKARLDAVQPTERLSLEAQGQAR